MMTVAVILLLHWALLSAGTVLVGIRIPIFVCPVPLYRGDRLRRLATIFSVLRREAPRKVCQSWANYMWGSRARAQGICASPSLFFFFGGVSAFTCQAKS